MANVIKAYFGGAEDVQHLGRSCRTSKECPGLLTLGGYLDGTMPEADKAAVEKHLVECNTCRRVVVELYLLLRMRPVPPAPADLVEAVKGLVPDGPFDEDTVQ